MEKLIFSPGLYSLLGVLELLWYIRSSIVPVLGCNVTQVLGVHGIITAWCSKCLFRLKRLCSTCWCRGSNPPPSPRPGEGDRRRRRCWRTWISLDLETCSHSDRRTDQDTWAQEQRGKSCLQFYQDIIGQVFSLRPLLHINFISSRKFILSSA